ncbi:MAG: SDR family oxidoreductase [Alphaproteobacteria bacterium]|nr:SDR family oxidoreductase [Alphaproteobacteria bacterium]
MPTVLVTGASRGLGLELCRQYAAEAWTVIACARSPDKAPGLAAIAGVRREALDVTDRDQVSDLARRLSGVPIDVVINNAGIYGRRDAGIGCMDFAEWEQVLRVNVLAPFAMAEALLPNLRAGGQKKLATVSSRMGSIAEASGNAVPYRSSKAALNMVMKCLATELAGQGIAVAVLHPGWVRTDMGGPGADLSPAESVAGMRKAIAALDLARSGQFVNYDGKTIPW